MIGCVEKGRVNIYRSVFDVMVVNFIVCIVDVDVVRFIYYWYIIVICYIFYVYFINGNGFLGVLI